MDNVFSSKYCCARLITTNLNRNGSPVSLHVLTAPVKEFKKVNNSISRVIRVLIDKQRILFSEVWDGIDNRTNTKTRGSKYKNALRTSIHIYNSQTSPIFDCVNPVSVSLATLARQLHDNSPFSD